MLKVPESIIVTEFLPIILAGSLSAQKVQVGSFKECSAKHKYFLNLFLILFCFACCCQVTSVVSDAVRPQRRQPTRLSHPWDSPGKNTGVGCHFLLQCKTVKSESEVAESCPTLSDPMDCGPPGSSIHGIFQARVLEWGAIAFSVALLRQVDKKISSSFLLI